MSHQALYRRFRSKNFDELVGQQHVVSTLKNQILSGNLAHAYLFCGIRGTGKTSTAKILARAVNCTNNTDGNPCNECEICKSILDDTNMDVIEMDAASNNGVENIRDLRDKVAFLPTRCKYKVYIIDEVHMLSKSAFNALLKTLEEPPAHLIFILATTEPQKIIPTVLSRCQRFDLKRITTDDMVLNMKQICEKIGVDAEEKALRLIAFNSDGAMRDALSILDRCLTHNTKEVLLEDVNELLGTLSFDSIVGICGNIVEKNIKNTMILISEVLDRGKEITLLIEECITYFRNLLILKSTNSTNNLIRISEDNAEELKKRIDSISIEEIVVIIKKLSDLLNETKRASNPRIIFEAGIIGLLESKSETNEALVKRIEELEKLVASGAMTNNTQSTQRSSSQTSTKISNTVPTKKTVVEPQVKRLQPTLNQNVVGSDSEAEARLINNRNEFLQAVKSSNIALLAIIREAQMEKVVNKTVHFRYDSKFSFHYTAANKESNLIKIKEILKNFLGDTYDVSFTIGDENANNNKLNSIEDVFEDLKNNFGEDKVILK